LACLSRRWSGKDTFLLILSSGDDGAEHARGAGLFENSGIPIDIFMGLGILTLQSLGEGLPYGREGSRKGLAKKLIKSSYFGTGLLCCNLVEVLVPFCPVENFSAVFFVQEGAAYTSSPHINKADEYLVFIFSAFHHTERNAACA